MSIRGVLVLDIDGTINPYNAQFTMTNNPEQLPGFEEYSVKGETNSDTKVFLAANQLRSAFSDLQDSGIELIWGSAWNENSNLILNMLFPEGVESWPTIIFPNSVDFSLSIQTWKLKTVREFIEAKYGMSTPVIWLDDEIFSDAEDWVKSRGHGLLLRTQRNQGVTQLHWDRIISFARALEHDPAILWQTDESNGSHLLTSIPA